MRGEERSRAAACGHDLVDLVDPLDPLNPVENSKNSVSVVKDVIFDLVGASVALRCYVFF